MAVFKSVCPLDCPDTCGLLVHVENGRAVKITGDPDHPLTKGFLCPKGYRHIDRLYSPHRLTHPLWKKSGGWQKISWEDAYQLLAEKLTSIKEQYGSTAVLLHDGAGNGGLLHDLIKRFANAYGGVTTTRGDLCWGCGIAAQEQDFGLLKIHSWHDILNARLIVLWGRDPETTNSHMVPLIKKARAAGAKLMVINPLVTAAAEGADLHLQPVPGTDGILALAMANVLIDAGLTDSEFTALHSENFAQYRKLAAKYPPEKAAEITGIPAALIRKAALLYGGTKPGTILLGYGMQRYANGGANIRLIDALAALAGNIGAAGGGVNYAHQLWRGLFNDLTGAELAKNHRQLTTPILADEIISADDPPIKAIIVTRSNPVNQLPNTKKVLQAFRSRDFVAVVDMFMTDTAQTADLVLPCTHFLEEENLIKSSWNYYLGYVPQILPPRGQCKPDYQIFTELARYMELPGFERTEPQQWLSCALQPLAAKYQLTPEKLADGAVRHPSAPDVPWADRRFSTPSGKFRFCTEEPRHFYEPPDDAYPLRLITAHHKRYINSQFANLDKSEDWPEVYIHPAEAEKRSLITGDLAVIAGRRGELKVKVAAAEKVPPKTALVYQGQWYQTGHSVNRLTPDFVPDLGPGTPFYDCSVEIKKV